MDLKRLREIEKELLEVWECIDYCPETDKKHLYNLVKRRERLVMEKTDLLSNKTIDG